MVDYRKRVEAEVEAIERTLSLLPNKPLSRLSPLELAGVATLIHNFYNGLENILKQVSQAKSFSLPIGTSWHQQLLNSSVERQLISAKLSNKLKDYLAFRHFFSHGYALNLKAELMEPLVLNISETFSDFKMELLDTGFQSSE